MRIGQGFDLHKLVENRPLILGGVIIPSNKGEEAHSDGDVLLHALIDALLGAKALGDIGTHFPPSDDEYKNISSVELLSRTLQLASFDIVNIDINIILQTPKLGPHIYDIRKNLSKLLNISIDNISVKAKTAEHILGELGRGDAIIAEVTLLIN